MSEKKYPTRMHEVLGVEVDEEFEIIDYPGVTFLVPGNGWMYVKWPSGKKIAGQDYWASAINNGIIRKPRLTEEAQEKEDHIIRLERMRSQKDQWANGKHAHWLETPADHAKDRDALDAAIEALTGKSRLTEAARHE